MATKEPKLTASEKKAQKRRDTAAQMEQVFGTGRGSSEPKLSTTNYMISLMRALNYYNAAYDNKDKRKWFMSYVGKTSKEFDSLSDFEFRSVGTLIRLKQRGEPLQEKELNFIDTTIESLRQDAKSGPKVSMVKGVQEEKEVKPTVSIQDRIKESAGDHIAEFNAMIDDFITSDTVPDFQSYLKSNDVSAAVAKHIPAAFNKTLAELEELLDGEDKQLVEGYSHIKKTKIKKLVAYVKAISDACAQQAVTAKAARKPRARKEKPPSVVAKNVKYMKEFADLGLKSVLPEKIIGASEVWLYNTKYKKLQVYRSVGALGIKGSAILNYDVATSGSKTLRKPEVTKDYVGMTKRTLASEFKALKTKEAAVNGRINSETIILRVF